MTTSHPEVGSVLSESRIEAFWRDGFVVVRGLIEEGQVRELLADYDRALRGEIAVPAFGDRRVKGAMVQLANPSLHMAHWRGHAYFRRALAAARLLIGPDAAYQYDQLIMKPAHYPAETDWHQDAGYWQDRNGSARAVTCWLVQESSHCLTANSRGRIQERGTILPQKRS